MKSRIPNSVLPSHGAAGVGPFAPRGGKSPHPAVVALAVFAGFVFLVLCVVAPGTGSDDLDTTGSGNGRRLTQWLAPVWYSLPTLFDSLYNLGESWTNFQLLPEEYRVAAEANARAALSQAREQVGGTAPDAALDATVDDENDSFIGGANANDLTRNDGPNEFNVGYDINADGFDAVRFMR